MPQEREGEGVVKSGELDGHQSHQMPQERERERGLSSPVNLMVIKVTKSHRRASGAVKSGEHDGHQSHQILEIKIYPTKSHTFCPV